jgi:hypothetical protein
MLSLKTKLISFALLAVAALAAGLWWGQHLPPPAASTAPQTNSVEAVKLAAPSPPPALQGALARAKQLPEGRAKEAFWVVARQWAQTNPPAALAWAAQLPEGEAKWSALREVGMAWARTDPKAAVAAAGTLPPGAGQDDFMRSIATCWAQTDPQAALAWAQQLPEGRHKDGALRNIVGMAWGQEDPKAAVEFASTLPAGQLATVS